MLCCGGVDTNDGWPAVANFDSDPFAEIIIMSRGYFRLYEHDGSLKWGPIPFVEGVGARCGAPTVADLDNDSQPEIGIACGTYYRVFETDGSLKWSQDVDDGSSGLTGSSIFDFEGDGFPEIVYSDQLYLRVFDGADGTILFETPISSGT
jgi:hypothetical protein